MDHAWKGWTGGMPPQGYSPQYLATYGWELEQTPYKWLMNHLDDTWYEMSHYHDYEYGHYAYVMALWDKKEVERTMLRWIAYNDTSEDVDIYYWDDSEEQWWWVADCDGSAVVYEDISDCWNTEYMILLMVSYNPNTEMECWFHCDVCDLTTVP